MPLVVSFFLHTIVQRREQRQWAVDSLRGLLLDMRRQSIEPMVLALHGADCNAIRALQQFVSEGAWPDRTILIGMGESQSAGSFISYGRWPLSRLTVCSKTSLHGVVKCRRTAGSAANCSHQARLYWMVSAPAAACRCRYQSLTAGGMIDDHVSTNARCVAPQH
jgi:hypothetical protein